MDVPARLPHEPETVAAEPVHVRIDHRGGGRHRHHRLDRVAAGRQDGLACQRGCMVGGGHRRGGEIGGFGHGWDRAREGLEVTTAVSWWKSTLVSDTINE